MAKPGHGPKGKSFGGAVGNGRQWLQSLDITKGLPRTARGAAFAFVLHGLVCWPHLEGLAFDDAATWPSAAAPVALMSRGMMTADKLCHRRR